MALVNKLKNRAGCIRRDSGYDAGGYLAVEDIPIGSLVVKIGERHVRKAKSTDKNILGIALERNGDFGDSCCFCEDRANTYCKGEVVDVLKNRGMVTVFLKEEPTEILTPIYYKDGELTTTKSDYQKGYIETIVDKDAKFVEVFWALN